MAESVQSYLPGIDPSKLTPDYAGIRPNISPPGSAFTDFMIRHAPARRGLLELHGFASPGLTSSLATGEYVAEMVRRDVWGEGAKMDAEKMAEGWEL
jgi:2-hydroxyglutarate dehydrogenase